MLELQAKLLLDTAKLLFHLIDPLLSNIAVEERAGGEGGVGMGVVVGVVVGVGGRGGGGGSCGGGGGGGGDRERGGGVIVVMRTTKLRSAWYIQLRRKSSHMNVQSAQHPASAGQSLRNFLKSVSAP